MTIRTIKKTYSGIPTVEGAGVNLTRFFSLPDVNDVDPFLLLDFFYSNDPADYRAGFPMHPHRGIETITYLIQGRISHEDSLGNKGVIEPLGCQWMTAGRSILHQEMPDMAIPIMGTQLWLNLPRAHKLTTPAYRDITETDVPIHESSDALVRIIAGSFHDHTGPVTGTFVAPRYFDVTIHPLGTFSLNVPEDDSAFIFMLDGEIKFEDNQSLSSPQTRGALLTEGDQISVFSHKGARLLFISAKPLREPIAWGGPIVMNTQEELRNAFRELREGTFINS